MVDSEQVNMSLRTPNNSRQQRPSPYKITIPEKLDELQCESPNSPCQRNELQLGPGVLDPVVLGREVKRATGIIATELELYISTPIEEATPVDFLTDVANFQAMFMKELGMIMPIHLKLLRKQLAIHRRIENGTYVAEEYPTIKEMDTGGAFEEIQAQERYDSRLWGDHTGKNYMKHLIKYVAASPMILLNSPKLAISLLLSVVGCAIGLPNDIMEYISTGLPVNIARFLHPYAEIDEQNRIDYARSNNVLALYYRAIGFSPLEAGRLDRIRESEMSAVSPETFADRFREFSEASAGAIQLTGVVAVAGAIGAVLYHHYKYALKEHLKKTESTTNKMADTIIGVMDDIKLELRWAKRWGVPGMPSEKELDKKFKQLNIENIKNQEDKQKKAQELSEFLDYLQEKLETRNAVANEWDEELDEMKDNLKEYDKLIDNLTLELESLESFEKRIKKKSRVTERAREDLYQDYKDTLENLKCKMVTPTKTKELLNETIKSLKSLKILLESGSHEELKRKLKEWESRRKEFLEKAPCPEIEALTVDAVPPPSLLPPPPPDVRVETPCPLSPWEGRYRGADLDSLMAIFGGKRSMRSTSKSMTDSVVDAFLAKKMAAQASVASEFD